MVRVDILQDNLVAHIILQMVQNMVVVELNLLAVLPEQLEDALLV